MIAEMETKEFKPTAGAIFLDPNLGPTEYGKTRVVETAADVVIDRSFVNCPRLRQCSKVELLGSQLLTNGKVIALSPVKASKETRC